MIRVHRVLLALHNIIVKAVLHVPGAFLVAIEAAAVGFILCEKQSGFALAKQPAKTVVIVLGLDDAHLARRLALPETGAADVRSPGPCVAIPDRRKQREFGLLRTTIHDLDTDAQIFRRGLGILHKDVEVAIFVEHTAVE